MIRRSVVVLLVLFGAVEGQVALTALRSNVNSYFVASHIPSVEPSARPSSHPTLKPSLLPSTYSSNLPSSEPSLTPSLGSATMPTPQPSHAPSPSPTAVCHDNLTYQSSINNLPCRAVRGTNCLQWRYLGLNTSEVQRLVENCPQSCNIPCGSFTFFQLNLTFTLQNVQNFLSPQSDLTMQQISIQYLTNFVDQRVPQSQFYLSQALLLSQQLVQPSDDIPQHQRFLRVNSKNSLNSNNVNSNYNASDTNVFVAVEYTGYAVNLSATLIRLYILQGLNDDGYTLALQRSGDPVFLDVVVTTQVGLIQPTPFSYTGNAKHGLSSGAVAGIVTVVAVLVGMAVAAVLYTKILRRMSLIVREYDEEDKDAFGSQVNSPAESQRSPLSQMLSADNIVRMLSSQVPWSEEGYSSTETGDTSDDSPPSRNGTVLETTSSAPVLPVPPPQSPPQTIYEAPVVEEHPLTGIIPPMIVIDHIDGEEEWESSKENYDQTIHKQVVPSWRMEAPPDFLATLNKRSTEQVVHNVFFRDPTYEARQRISENCSIRSVPATNARVPIGADDRSVLSAPVVRSFDSSKDESRLNVSLPTHAISLSSIHIPDSPTSRHTRDDSQFSCTSDLSSSMHTCRDELAIPPATIGSVIEDMPELPVLSLRERTLSEASTVKAGDQHLQSSRHPLSEPMRDAGNFLQSLWGLSPSRKIQKGSHSSSSVVENHQPTTVAVAAAASVHSHSARTRSTFHKRTASRCSTSSSDCELAENEAQLVFQAPRKQKLGLVIQSEDGIGPTIACVKDYSPLLGQVKVGDRIAKIDGTKTSHMTSSEAMTLLTGRQAGRWSSSSSIRITVIRSRALAESTSSLADDDCFMEQIFGGNVHGSGMTTMSPSTTASNAFHPQFMPRLEPPIHWEMAEIEAVDMTNRFGRSPATGHSNDEEASGLNNLNTPLPRAKFGGRSHL